LVEARFLWKRPRLRSMAVRAPAEPRTGMSGMTLKDVALIATMSVPWPMRCPPGA
jgi:hypothetical protein